MTQTPLEDLQILQTLKSSYAPDQGDAREHNANETSLGFGILHYAFVRNLQPELALVLGSRYGFVPACVALALKANGKGRLHFVDANYSDQQDGFNHAYGGVGHWNKSRREEFSALDLYEWIDVFVKRTAEFFLSAPRNYGYIYIDADHSYEGVRRDCEEAVQHLAPGGIIAFHDALVENASASNLPAEFGVKAYLQDHFPGALVLHRWPGLAFIQPSQPAEKTAGLPADGINVADSLRAADLVGGHNGTPCEIPVDSQLSAAR